MKYFTMTLSLGLYKKLDAYAKENGVTIRGAIRTILLQFFNNNNITSK